MPPRKRTRDTAPPPSLHNIALPLPEEAARDRHSSLRETYERGELCDGQVVLGERVFPVSRMTLAASSPFFRAAFSSGMREGASLRVTLDPTLPIRCVEALLSYAHAPGGEFAVESLEQLVVAADQLGFTSVLPIAAEKLRATLTPSNCIDRLVLSERHGLPTLSRGCIEVVGQHYAEPSMKRALASLSQGCLVVLLSHEPAVMAEERIFEILLAWLENYEDGRSPLFPTLLELVRLPSLGIAYLSEHVMYAPSVLAAPRAQQLVRDAVRFLGASPEERERLATKRLRPRHAPLLLPEHTLRVAGTRLVSNFCEFRAEPDGAKPDGRTIEQSEEPFEIPPGWRVVRTSDDDWEQVRRRCIGEWNWSTDVVVVGDGDAESGAHDEDAQRYVGFCARDYNDDDDHPASEYDRRPNLKPVTGQPGWLQFSGVSYRLLLRREVL